MNVTIPSRHMSLFSVSRCVRQLSSSASENMTVSRCATSRLSSAVSTPSSKSSVPPVSQRAVTASCTSAARPGVTFSGARGVKTPLLAAPLAAAPRAAAPPGRDDPSGRCARGEQTVRTIAELCGVQVGGRMSAEAVRAYVAHPSCEELAEQALQEVREVRAVGAPGEEWEVGVTEGEL